VARGILADDVFIIQQSNQPVIGSSTTALSDDLTLRSGATLEVFGVLQIDNDLNNEGLITFKSNVSGSGQFDEFNGTISGSGSVRTERFIPAGDNVMRAYRLLSPSVNSTGTIRDNWQEGVNNPNTSTNLNPNPGYGTHISGSTTGANGFDATSSGQPSLYTFDTGSQDWAAVTNTVVDGLIAGEGYLLMVRGDRSINLNTLNPPPTNTTLLVEGDLVTGQVNYGIGDLDQTDDEFNLIGNPYQSILDYSNTTRTGLTDYIYVWDASIGGINGVGGYVSVEIPVGANQVLAPGVGTSDANQFIAPGQAFFIHNLTDGVSNSTLTINEIDKAVAEAEVTVFGTYSDYYLNVNLFKTSDLQIGETASDGIGLRFSSSFTTLADDEDAVKFFNNTENLAIVNNGLRSIDKQDIPTIGHVIDLDITNYTDTNYSFTFDTENQPTSFAVYLVDNYLGTQTEILSGTVYDFTVDNSIPASVASDRFNLLFDDVLGVNNNTFENNISLYPNPSKNGRFSIKTPNLNGSVEVAITNYLGQQVYNQDFTIQNQEVNINAENLSTGIYIVRMTQGHKSFSTKLILE
jgi:hypothetical protein